jgi:putative spermidine/putrescine transport system permease protein
VLITDQAIYQTNMPMAASMAIFFMIVSLLLVVITMAIGKGKKIDTQ